MDLPDVRRDFFQLWTHVGPAVAAGRVRIVLMDSVSSNPAGHNKKESKEQSSLPGLARGAGRSL